VEMPARDWRERQHGVGVRFDEARLRAGEGCHVAGIAIGGGAAAAGLTVRDELLSVEGVTLDQMRRDALAEWRASEGAAASPASICEETDGWVEAAGPECPPAVLGAALLERVRIALLGPEASRVRVLVRRVKHGVAAQPRSLEMVPLAPHTRPAALPPRCGAPTRHVQKLLYKLSARQVRGPLRGTAGWKLRPERKPRPKAASAAHDGKAPDAHGWGAVKGAVGTAHALHAQLAQKRAHNESVRALELARAPSAETVSSDEFE